MHHRFLDKRSPLPLHRSWADWLWRRALAREEAVPLQSAGVVAYRCDPDAEALRDDLSVAVASGLLTLPREEPSTPTTYRERRHFMRLAAQAKGGFYPTPPRVTDLIAELIQPPAAYARNDETLRILDPCCGEGEALSRLAEGLGKPHAAPVETFGVELHSERAEEAKYRLDRVLGTDLFATSIANGAFGLLYLNPPVRLGLG